MVAGLALDTFPFTWKHHNNPLTTMSLHLPMSPLPNGH